MSNLFLDNSIPELSQKLETQELSCVDFVAEVVNVINAKEEQTRAWVNYDFKQLQDESFKADVKCKKQRRLSVLDGMPFGIKDIFNTKSYPTEMGSPIWKEFTPGNNARVVDSLIVDGGAIAVGKTVTAEFAVHALNETLNPHDKSRTPGTSSSGSAAAVATGMVPFSLATQTAGSIVRPASFCGIWGMKPSFGLIPRTGVLKTTDSLDTIGFVAAHANSLRPILDVARVRGRDYPFVFEKIDSRGNYPKSKNLAWRIGFLKTHTWSSAALYAQEAIYNLAQKINNENDFVVEEIDWPDDLQDTHEVHETIYAKSLSYYFKREQQQSSRISSLMVKMIQEGEKISTEAYKEALQRQVAISRKLDSLLTSYDIVLTLSTASSAPLRNVEELRDPSLIWTLGHLPSVTAPVFRCPEGLPFGAQFISQKWNDYLLLQGIEKLVSCEILPVGSLKVLDKKYNLQERVIVNA